MGHEELPPRARRIQWDTCWAVDADGTTSACAENTEPPHHLRMIGGNYLRVRGEYQPCYQHSSAPEELPPRARRIRSCHDTPLESLGTTSACAENTTLGFGDLGKCWNYLRVRGEYVGWGCCRPKIWELPPRARRIRRACLDRGCFRGTTSACAENTATGMTWCTRNRNYLRVRGEYDNFPIKIGNFLELPPRARRILPPDSMFTPSMGTTSACAENTSALSPQSISSRNYLRVRGEYLTGNCATLRKSELPPRARRIP